MKKENIRDVISGLEKTSQKVRGEVIIDHISYIKRKEGSGGVEKLKEKMVALGISFDLKKIKPESWVSNDLSSQIIIIAHHIFHWNSKDVFEMGYSAPRFPIGIKVLVQTILSSEKMFKEIPIYWQNIFNFGKIEPLEFNEELQRAKLQIKEIKTIHPILYSHMQGYLKGLAEFILPGKEITIEQSKCTVNGDKLDEYIIYWR